MLVHLHQVVAICHTSSPVLEHNIYQVGSLHIKTWYVSYAKQICQTEATEAVLEPLIVAQLIAVFLGIARSRAWVGFRCGVFMYQRESYSPAVRSCRSSWSRYTFSGALGCFSLLFPPLATLILETVPLVTVQVRRVHASPSTIAPINIIQ